MSSQRGDEERRIQGGGDGAGGEYAMVCGDDGCRVQRLPDGFVDRVLKEAREAKRQRAADMPTTKDALDAMHRAYTRLKELGWRSTLYAPRDGTFFHSIEPGSTGVHETHVIMLDTEHPTFWVDGEWPARPALFRPLDATDAPPPESENESQTKEPT